MLEILGGQARYRKRPIINPLSLIGSGADCDLVLAMPELAEIHSCLAVTSTGATWKCLQQPWVEINGKPQQVATLADGDTIALADYRFRIHLETPGEAKLDPIGVADQPNDEVSHPRITFVH